MTTGLSPHKHRGISRSGCLKLESPTLIMTLASSNRRHIRASFSHSSSKYLRAPEETTCSLLFCLMHKKIALLGVDFTDKVIPVIIIADSICTEVVAPSQLSFAPGKIRHIHIPTALV